MSFENLLYLAWAKSCLPGVGCSGVRVFAKERSQPIFFYAVLRDLYYAWCSTRTQLSWQKKSGIPHSNLFQRLYSIFLHLNAHENPRITATQHGTLRTCSSHSLVLSREFEVNLLLLADHLEMQPRVQCVYEIRIYVHGSCQTIVIMIPNFYFKKVITEAHIYILKDKCN